MIVQHMSNKVFIEVLIFVNYIQITIIPLSLINTTPLNYRGETVFLSSELHSSCLSVSLKLTLLMILSHSLVNQLRSLQAMFLAKSNPQQRLGQQHPDGGHDCFLVRRHCRRSLHALGAHDRAGRQFEWARDVGLHVFCKIMLFIMGSWLPSFKS